MQPRDRLTAKEIQVAILVWQGLTNEDIAGVLLTSEQAVKNYLRTAFDKLGVWTRLELALYVAGHGGANWHMQVGNGLLPPGVERRPGTSIFEQRSNQRKALRKRRAVVREAGMHRWSDGRLARPAWRGGRGSTGNLSSSITGSFIRDDPSRPVPTPRPWNRTRRPPDHRTQYRAATIRRR